MRGSHFDPDLVDVFLEEIPAILAIRQRYSEPEELSN